MRKQWIKKESLYHKPFYKQKLKMTMLGVLLLGVVFFGYQVFYINQLQLNAAVTTPHVTTASAGGGQQQQQLIVVAGVGAGDQAAMFGRGVRHRDLARYQSNAQRTFQCLRSGELLPDAKLNDDYCDCADGSDEPATNACPTGVFYCAHRMRHPRAGIDRQTNIPNSRINDGICDCCDGSDEWLPHRRTDNRPVACPERCA